MQQIKGRFKGPNNVIRYSRKAHAVILARGYSRYCRREDTRIAAVRSFFDHEMKHSPARWFFMKFLPPGKQLRNIDAPIRRRRGTPFEYAAVAACMLRTLNIPTKVCIGKVDGKRYAWNVVYVGGQWSIVDIYDKERTRIKTGACYSYRASDEY